MDIHVLYAQGKETIVLMNSPGSERCRAAMAEFTKSYLFCKEFYRSRSYVAAYLASCRDSKEPHEFLSDIFYRTCSIPAKDEMCELEFALDEGLHKNILNNASIPYPRVARLEQLDYMHYHFFLECITSREMRIVAGMLLFSGFVALTFGLCGLAGLETAVLSLNALGVQALPTAVGGTLSSAIGGFLLFSKAPNDFPVAVSAPNLFASTAGVL